MVISDVHLGSIWFTDKAKMVALERFLGELAQPTTRVHTLVVAGDLLENWLDTIYDTPQPFSQILRQTNLYGCNVANYMTLFQRVVNNSVCRSTRHL